jgi:MFS family permease
VAVLLGGATALMPVFARDILRVGPSGLGWLNAAPSAGAVVMAIVLATRRPLERAGRALLVSVVGFGIATVVFGLSRSFPLSLAALAALGALDSVSVVIRSSLLQLLTPDELRGRVASVNALFIGTSNELGGFESGSLAAVVGPVASVVAGGVGTVVTVVAIAVRWPALRRLGRVQEAA